MTLLVLLLLLVLAAVLDLVHEVRTDGHRPPPASHPPYFSPRAL